MSVIAVPASCGDESEDFSVVVVAVDANVTVVALELIALYVPSDALVAVTMQVPVPRLESDVPLTRQPVAVPFDTE